VSTPKPAPAEPKHEKPLEPLEPGRMRSLFDPIDD
jgi:hypothetical protein